MGLRFRRSVKICDGLKLNFGKTGMSMTVGSGPIKKTFNTNGNVTTTVGLPGTGIYWTETERRGSRNNRGSQTTQLARSSRRSQQSDYQIAPAVDDYFSQDDYFEQSNVVEDSGVVPVSQPHNTILPINDESQVITEDSPTILEEVRGLSAEAIKRIYLYEDAPIDWTELIAGATADDLLMDQTLHAYCAQMAPRILSGDVNAYLDVIERMRPVDDLALYCGDFEFGTDSPSYIEVEFNADPDKVLSNGYSDVLYEEFISAVTVRVARDLFALLPIKKVLAHVDICNNTVLSVVFTRNQLCNVSFRNSSATMIIAQFPHQKTNSMHCHESVNRMTL